MNTITYTQIIWISNEVPNLQNNLDEVVWCKTIDDAKHTIQEYEIETINSKFLNDIQRFIKPIEKLVVEDSKTYGLINLWLSETNRQYLMDKVELIPREVSSGNINTEMTRYILTTVEHGMLKYFSQKDVKSFDTFLSTDIKDAILYNREIEAEEQARQAKIYSKTKVSIRKIKIDAKINYIY